MGLWYSISGVLALLLFVLIGAGMGLYTVFGIFIPYLAAILFLAGFIYRVLKWASSPVDRRRCGEKAGS
jgi:hypothetical protein